MKALIGLALILAGVIGGLYFGLWWAFIGGIVDVINAAIAPNIDAQKIALGIAKFAFSGIIGWLVFVLFVVPGNAILQRA